MPGRDVSTISLVVSDRGAFQVVVETLPVERADHISLPHVLRKILALRLLGSDHVLPVGQNLVDFFEFAGCEFGFLAH